jgi:LysR family glycine cleavage system transcriptional activator
MPLHRNLPPLPALRVFEAVARHLSFVRAAEELAVTQSAVSHQIQKLEQSLGAQLFVRRTRAIDLTSAGKRYYDRVRQSLEWIAEGTREIRGDAGRAQVLKVALLSSFAANWLAPRLSGFTERHGDIDVQLIPSIEQADVAGGSVDIAIRYGKGCWPNVSSVLLMTERLSPVCSPAYLASRQSNRSLAGFPDIALLMSHAQPEFEWEAWSSNFGTNIAAFPKRMLHDYNIVLEAAAAGQGIAMGRHRLIQSRLNAGTLVEALPDVCYEGRIGHWLVTRTGTPREAVQDFVEWITKAARQQDLTMIRA